jgi:hypothetical protein
MKRVVLCAFLLLFVMCGFVSAGQFGPTEPTASPGKFSLETGYFWNDTKWKMDYIDDFRTQSNQFYVQASFAPTKSLEIFGRLGGADLSTKGTVNNMSDTSNMFGTIGGKAMLYQHGIFGFGAFAQGTHYFSDYKDNVNLSQYGGFPVNVAMTDYYDVQGGLSGQVKVQNFILYGGGFWYYAQAHVNVSTPIGVAPPFLGSISLQLLSEKLREQNAFGGFMGVKVPLTKRFSVNVEGQLRDRISGGMSLVYAF